MLREKRLFGSELSHIHYWEKRSRSVCVWCSYKLKRQKVIEKGKGRNSKQANKPYEGCVFCKVSLCKEGDCWAAFHSKNADY